MFQLPGGWKGQTLKKSREIRWMGTKLQQKYVKARKIRAAIKTEADIDLELYFSQNPLPLLIYVFVHFSTLNIHFGLT